MGKLTIQDIAKVLVTKNRLDQRSANRFAAEAFAVIKERLQQGEAVKVKGLGTWKIIGVEARESVSVRTGERVVIDGHSKVSFTPDATMKELVNKPFSHFETVVLNEGVEFEDLQDDLTEDELKEEQAMEIAPVVEAANITSEVEEPVETEIVEAPHDADTESPIAVETHNEPQKLADLPSERETDEDEDADDEEVSRPWGKWLLCACGILALMAVSAFGGYYYGSQHQTAATIADTVFVNDTIYMAALNGEEMLEVDDDENQTLEEPESVTTPEAADEKQQTAEIQHTEEVKTAQDVADPYAAKDERVRLGAYRIVGLDYEVKVLEGQTFYSICRAHLGPDMECYVEVFNDLPRNPTIKVGQTIKIPKLQIKKSSRR